MEPATGVAKVQSGLLNAKEYRRFRNIICWISNSAPSLLVRDYRRRNSAQLPNRRWSLIPHPNGIVIHPDSRIGPNSLFFQQVTIGANWQGFATIGGYVDIGAGAKIIGPVSVREHAKIGANAVVVGDIPAGAIAVGIPARVIQD